MRAGDAVWLLTYPGPDGSVDVQRVTGRGAAPIFDVFTPSAIVGDTDLHKALVAAGPIVRVRNGDIWDGLATGVIRQVIRASQARLLYLRLCDAHGEKVAAQINLFPSPDTVLGLSDAEFAGLGLAFKREPLRAAARAVTAHGDEWLGLPPPDLLVDLQKIERVGPWTAGAVTADLTGDFSVYPYADLAVRTWAARLSPETPWSAEEIVFAKRWRELGRDQLATLTALTLAQGAHV